MMWSKRVVTLLQRASKRRSSSSAGSMPLSLGAALSLVALAEWDRRSSSSSSRNDNHNECNPPMRLLEMMMTSTTTTTTRCDGGGGSALSSTTVPEHPVRKQQHRHLLRHRQTVRKMEDDSSKQSLESRYRVDWDSPLGEGSFGVVFLGVDRTSGQRVAVKKISKLSTGLHEFLLEMRALLHLKDSGGHPNICSLRENFSEDGYYYLILDLVEGCEMFEHLVAQGAYSEADAARLVREVASALAFLHGLGVIHCDLKPENLMLSSKNNSDAVIKLIDFGCAMVVEGDDDDVHDAAGSLSLKGRTLAYCPPEILDQSLLKLDPSVDMWALGVILYIMLTGIHPFDLSGQATDDEVAQAIVDGKAPPIRNSAITAHLSDSAVDLIDRLMQQDANKRISADQMLQHPWTRGVTASRDKMVDSDKKLSMYRVYKSGIAEKVFENIISWSDEQDNNDVSRRSSLIERSFRALDPTHKGYLTRKDLQSLGPQTSEIVEPDDMDSSRLSLSGFSDLLEENMKNCYFPKGSVIYREGEVGNAMYFINSGTISVETTGSVVKRGPGDFFGEGALLHPKKLRSATIKCDTPVHAMEIGREYFEKYLSKSDSGLLLNLREKDKIRKRNRAKMILRLQGNLIERSYAGGDVIFETGDKGDSLFLVERGRVHIMENGQNVFTATPGNVFGEYSLITGRPRNCSAYCADGCVLQEMLGNDFRKLTDTSPDIMASLRDLSLRRDFKKAVVLRLKKEFPYDNPREAFDVVKIDECRDLNKEAVGSLMRELNPEYTDEEILEIIQTLNLTNSGAITFDEFKKVFVADIRKSASI